MLEPKNFLPQPPWEGPPIPERILRKGFNLSLLTLVDPSDYAAIVAGANSILEQTTHLRVEPADLRNLAKAGAISRVGSPPGMPPGWEQIASPVRLIHPSSGLSRPAVVVVVYPKVAPSSGVVREMTVILPKGEVPDVGLGISFISVPMYYEHHLALLDERFEQELQYIPELNRLEAEGLGPTWVRGS